MMESQSLVAESQHPVPDSFNPPPPPPIVTVTESVNNNNNNGLEVVIKKKRGRPPKSQSQFPAPVHLPKPKPKPKPISISQSVNKQKDEEDVCFICFDGGSLVLCDRRGCPKAYHPACIKRDEAFFESAAKWNCGWHICSICQKTAHHMCYTCTYSLCRGCIRKADYVCVRGDKGFCTICMKTIMLIENNGQGEDGKVQADFDDKLSWEYLFKVYWVYLKGKLSLTLNELTEAKNPWKEACTISSSLPSNAVHNKANELRSITSPTAVHNVEENESKRRKVDEQINIPLEETVNMEKLENAKSESVAVVECKDWATKELLDFVAHMKDGNTSELSRFDVQALMMEYINKNNLRDPKKKNQIICDSRLNSLFGKPRVGHIQILKLLEHHFLVKENLVKENLVKENLRKTRVKRTAVPDDADWTSDNVLTISKDKKRRNLGKGKEDALQNKLDDFAAVDAYNMNLIYLRRDLMENLLEEGERFHGKVVGSIVKIRILGSDLKHDMYRLVQVVGTSKVDVPYKIGNKSTDVMLEVLNLDKKETISIDTISDQDFSEEECRRLQQSIRCGLVNHFTVGEIQEKAVALQSLKLNDWMEKEILRLTHLRDTASGKKHKKGYRECVEKLELLKTPDERERRLQQIPVVHSDPKMNPHYESDDTEEYFNKEHGDHMESKYSGVSSKSSRSPIKRAGRSNDTENRSRKDEKLSIEEGSTKETLSIHVEKDASASTLEKSQQEVDFKGSTVTKLDQQATIRSPVSNNSPETIASSPNDSVWHYLDPNGKVQGPFSLIQLQRWSTTGYFPADMRIWANHKDKSLLLNDVLRDQFKNYENITATNKVGNQVEGLNVCSAAPSPIVAATQYADEKLADNNGSSGQSFGQNWSANKNLNSSPLNEPTVHLNTSSEADIRHAPVAVIDLPGPTPKNMVDEKEKILLVQDSGNPPSWSSASSLVVGGAKLPVSNEWDAGSFPVKREQWVESGIVSVSSFKPPEAAGDHVATPTSNIDQNVNQSQPAGNDFTTWHGMGEMIEFSTLAEESVSDLLAEVDAMESQHGLPSPTSRRNSFVDDLFNGSFDEFSPTPDQGTRSDGFSSSGDIQLPCQSTNPATTTTTTATTDEHLVGFDFMKTSNDVQQHSFITPDVAVSGIPQRTNSESLGFKWTDMERAPQGMIDINASAKAEGDEGEMETKIGELEAKENGNYDLHQSFAQRDTHHSHGGSEMSHGGLGGGIVQNPEPMVETKSGEAMQVQKSFGIGAKLVSRVAQIKGLEGTTNHRRTEEEEDGEFIKPEEPQQKQLLPPPPPPPLTLGLDPFDPCNLQSDTMQGKSNHTGRLGEGRSGNTGWDLNPNTDPNPNTSSNPNPNPNPNQNQRRSGAERYNSSSNSPRERSYHVEEPGYTRSSRSSLNKQSSLGSGNGNVGWDLNPSPDPNPRRSGGERYNSSSKSPRERSHHVEEPGYTRSSRSYWNKQSSLGTGSGGGYSKPSKGQRCRFYESGRCKKGASCKYLHTPK